MVQQHNSQNNNIDEFDWLHNQIAISDHMTEWNDETGGCLAALFEGGLSDKYPPIHEKSL
jgi:hypothetical protein